MTFLTVGLLSVLAVILLLTIRVPVGIALMLPSMVGVGVIVGDLSSGFKQGVSSMFASYSTPSFAIIPLYLLLGSLAFSTGIAGNAFTAANVLVGRIRGGLAVATCLASGMLAAVSGSSMATVATMGKTAYPSMMAQGYSRSLASAVICASGTVGILIPPSVILVLYGVLAEVSIGRLLLAGIMPGLLSVAASCMAVLYVVKRHPERAPVSSLHAEQRATSSLLLLWPILVIFAVVVGGIYSGLLLPVEAAALGILCVVLIGAMRRSLAPRPTGAAILDAAKQSAAIGLIVAGAFVFARLVSLSGMSESILNFVSDLAAPAWIILAGVLVVLFFMGMFVEGVTILALTVPLLAPLMTTLEYDLVWFGIILVKMIEVSLITPPIGLNLFVFSSIVPSVGIIEIFRGIIPFIVMDVVVVATLILFPDIALWLPDLVFD